MFWKKRPVIAYDTSVPRKVPERLAKVVAAALKPHGYVRHGQSFYKTENELTRVINLQASRWNQDAGGDFYINVAFFHRPTYEVEWNSPAPDWPQEYHGQLRQRLSSAAPRKVVPEKFTYHETTDIEAWASDIADAIIAYGVPFPKSIQTLPQLRQAILNQLHLDSGSTLCSFYAAVFSAFAGDAIQATKDFDKLVATVKPGPYRDMFLREIIVAASKLNIKINEPPVFPLIAVGFYIPSPSTQLTGDARKTRNKIDLYLTNFEKKYGGYQYFKAGRSETEHRLVFMTTEPKLLISYIKERQMKLPLALSRIVANDTL